MQLHHNSCVEDPLVLNQRNSQSQTACISKPPPADLRLAICDGGMPSVYCDSDLMISTTPAHRESSATASLGSCTDLHLMTSGQPADQPPLSSRQPRILFSSSAAAADHERGFAVTGSWSPRCYTCSFCGREFNSAQALGGHMNIHRRDRARLRTSASLASVPHQADLPPIPPPQSSAYSNPYHPFEPAFTENPTSIASSCLDTYPSTIISATPPFRLLDMHPAADPALLPSAAHPSHEDNLAASLTAPLMDLGPFHSSSARSSATRLSKFQNEAHLFFPNIAPHASPLLIMPNSSLIKPMVEAAPGQLQASTQQVRLDCSGAHGGAHELTQFSQSRGRNKRAREDVVTISGSEVKSTVQRCDEASSNSISSSEKGNSLDAAAASRSCGRPSPNIENLICLDLELRLGQSSRSDSRASTAGNCCGAVRTTARLPP